MASGPNDSLANGWVVDNRRVNFRESQVFGLGISLEIMSFSYHAYRRQVLQDGNSPISLFLWNSITFIGPLTPPIAGRLLLLRLY